jgi:hypothetical protein
VAKHCTNCGHELREGDKFCAECGTTTDGTAPQVSPVEWEYCEVDIVDAGDRALGGSTYMWVATAVGRRGMYEVGRSPRYNGWPRGHRDSFNGQVAPPIGSELEGYREKLTIFVNGLASGGWQPIQERGQHWYSYKFRRQSNATQTSAASTYQPLTGAIRTQWTATFIQQGATAALMMLDSYIASAPKDSDDYIEALFEQLHIYSRELHNRDESTRIFEQIDDALERRLEREPRNTKLLEYNVKWWHERGNRDGEKEAKSQLQLVTQGLPLSWKEFTDHYSGLYNEDSLYYNEAQMTYVNQCLSSPLIDGLTRIESLRKKALLLRGLALSKDGREERRLDREADKLKQEARALCDRELARNQPKPGEGSTLYFVQLKTIREDL